MPLEAPHIARRVTTSRRVEELNVRLSPDGKWLSYTSIAAGVPEVYVQDFPSGKDTWRVSTAGGTHARWRADSKEIFYLADNNMLMSVALTTRDTFQPQTPHALFRLNVVPEQLMLGSVFAINADGQRFVIQHVLNSRPAPLSVVLGWNSSGGAIR